MSRVRDRPIGEDAWNAHMRRGDFAAAWRISDAVLRRRGGAPCRPRPRHQQSIWNGGSLAGRRVLVRCYHGLGDTVQFIRFAPQLKEVAAETIVWAQPALLPLLRTARGIDRLLPLHDGTPEIECDAEVEIMELAHVFRVTPATLPSTVPYLLAEPAPWVRERTPAGDLAVGIVWCAGDWDERRSIPAELIAPLAHIPGVTLHVLQMNSKSGADPVGAAARGAVEPVAALARAIRALDLMISVDSLPVHLAGALGVPTWALLPAQADWRWMENRRDSPWYPTMRLWRQPPGGGWAPVLTAVAEELASAGAVENPARTARNFSACPLIS